MRTYSRKFPLVEVFIVLAMGSGEVEVPGEEDVKLANKVARKK